MYGDNEMKMSYYYIYRRIIPLVSWTLVGLKNGPLNLFLFLVPLGAPQLASSPPSFMHVAVASPKNERLAKSTCKILMKSEYF